MPLVPGHKDVQVLMPDWLFNKLEPILRPDGEFVHVPHLQGEDDLPIYVYGLTGPGARRHLQQKQEDMITESFERAGGNPDG